MALLAFVTPELTSSTSVSRNVNVFPPPLPLAPEAHVVQQSFSILVVFHPQAVVTSSILLLV